MVDGEWLMADGRWPMVDGEWLIVDGWIRKDKVGTVHSHNT